LNQLCKRRKQVLQSYRNKIFHFLRRKIHMAQLKFPAVYMRGGTSKGVFFKDSDLPAEQTLRDKVLLRVIGSPDPYGKHIDGMGGATSSTSKVVILSRSARADCDVDYLFGAVAVAAPVIDWSGNCGNLTTAVGPFAIRAGFVDSAQQIRDGVAMVRIWQTNIEKRIVAYVPMKNGEVDEQGTFELDGVTFPAAEVRLEFLDPGADEDSESGAMLPTGRAVDTLEVPGVGKIDATLINAGNPTVFIHASTLGLRGNEMQDDINQNPALLATFETIRAHAAVAMGLAATAAEVSAKRPHTPKIAFISEPQDYVSSSGKTIHQEELNLNARILSMGKLHHAMTGTGAVAIAVAAAIPGTLVNRIANQAGSGTLCFGHPSGTLEVGAETAKVDGQWVVRKAMMSRSARRLMEGHVFVSLDDD
jgi:probable AcnD-accessory protein PrpF